MLKSFSWFATTVARELDIGVTVSEGEKHPHKMRKTLLKSAFVHSKHRVQYEMRTYYWVIKLDRMTESTKDTYLEYVERNLPEGVAMKVISHELTRLPENIREALKADAAKKEQLRDENRDSQESVSDSESPQQQPNNS